MRGRRALLIVLVIVATLVVVAYLVWQNMPESPGVTDGEVVATATPVPVINVLVSAQDPIPRGWRFQPNDGAVTIQEWPEGSEPPVGSFTSEDQIAFMYAAQNIPVGTPILKGMLSETAIAPFPEGRVAYGLPMDMQGGLGWHIQEGDHVDVLVAIQLTNVDTEFQSKLPNLYQTMPDPALEGAAELWFGGEYGRFETLPNGMAGMITPNGDPFPQLVVQLIVQDAIVWHIGAKIETGDFAPAPEAEPAPAGGVLGQAEPEPTVAAAAMAPQLGDVELVSLLVTPQDALILKYLYDIGSDLDLVVRAPGDSGTSITGAVWSRYILDRYQIPQEGFDLPYIPTQMRVPIELTPIATPVPEEQQ